ncbi:DUF6578 domain-containing protein, partial [Jatrophihabitans sp.]|uniref:DUF6578 domain-containing protein n=1 Tax=Jatrophihabitans sp. TaxID=1932789 RepID=UPI0038CD4936
MAATTPIPLPCQPLPPPSRRPFMIKRSTAGVLGDPLLVRAFVWVDAWQQQCCGETFRLGSEIHWHGHRTMERKSWITT